MRVNRKNEREKEQVEKIKWKIAKKCQRENKINFSILSDDDENVT